jgi:hypothetical protein
MKSQDAYDTTYCTALELSTEDVKGFVKQNKNGIEIWIPFSLDGTPLARKSAKAALGISS